MSGTSRSDGVFVGLVSQNRPAEPEVSIGDGGGLVKQSLDPEGWKWRVQVIEFGMSLTRDIWEREPFAESLARWQGVKCYADHISESEIRDRPERSVRDLVGWWSTFEVTQTGVDATLTIKPSAEWLKNDLKASFADGKKDFYGFSISAVTKAEQTKGPDGKPARRHTKIVRPLSIDVVTDAAANGHVKYALASSRVHKDEGDNRMKKLLLAFLKADESRFKLVRQSAPLVAAGVTETMTEEEVTEKIGEDEKLVEQALSFKPPVEKTEPEKEEEPGKKPVKQAAPPSDEGEIAFNRLPKVVRDGLVNQAYRDSELPEAVQQAIRKEVGEDAALEQHERAIKSCRSVLALTSQSGQVNNPGRIQIGAESRDKITLGLAKSFNLTKEQFCGVESYVESEVRQAGRQPFRPSDSDWQNAKPIHSIKRLYIEMTGDEYLRGIGHGPDGNRITRQAQTPWALADFPDLLSNLMHKRLLASYREVDYGIDLVTAVKALTDFKAQQVVILGYFGDLSSVAENAEYTTLAALSDDKETYSPSKRGNTVDLGIESIANDDLRGIAQAPDRMGRSARRTLAKFIWNSCLFSNPTLNQDGVALFHASHNNLITDALATAGLAAGITKLLRQTEPGSSEQFGFSTVGLTLAFRSELTLTAKTLTDFNNEPEGNTDALARMIRRSDKGLSFNLVPLPFLSDANDWLLAVNKGEADIVEIGYWMGQTEPEFFQMSGETHEKAFNNDIIVRHKVRFIFGGAPVDFRPVVKSVVT